MIGRAIGRYRIVARLGQGAMGHVYLADDTSLDRQVTIKVLAPEWVADEEHRQRLVVEAKAASALSHPNICTVHEVGVTAEGEPFIAMEYVSGPTLAERLRQRPLDVRSVIEFGLQIAEALDAAHARGIVHRDIKPSNIRLTDRGQIKVLDFGLAKRLVPATADGATMFQTRAGVVLGTPAYMAPEQALGRPVDGRADIFSLGVLLYELTTGRRPFRGESDVETMDGILNADPEPVARLNRHAPAALERIILKCLAKDAGQRYQAARDVRTALEELTAAVQGGTVGAVNRAGAGRRRAPIWIAAAASLAVVGAILAGYWNASRPAPAEQVQWVAVLPFDGATGAVDESAFTRGINLALIEHLARIKALNVKAFASMARYANSDLPIRQIADELRVDALVKGTLLREGSSVRVHVELVQGRTEDVIWAGSFDRNEEGLLSLVSDVARAIAGELQIVLSPSEETLFAPTRLVHPQALSYYLDGRRAVDIDADTGRGMELFQQAVELDPQFAQAWAGLGVVHVMRGVFGEVGVQTASGAARPAIQRALELDPTCDLAHSALALVLLYFDWDFEAAARELQRALNLRPNESWTRHAYADYLIVRGDAAGSLDQALVARQYDPGSLLASASVASHLILARRYSDAIEEIRESQRRFPGREAFFRGIEAQALWYDGRFEESIAVRAPREETLALDRGLREGGPREAMRLAATFLADAAQRGRADEVGIASRYALAGDADAAFAWLDRALERRPPDFLHIVLLPAFDSLRADGRWGRLLNRAGIPQSPRAP